METRKYDLSDYVMSMFRREKMGRTVIYFNIYVHVYLLQFLELRVSFNYLNQQSVRGKEWGFFLNIVIILT